MNGTTLLKFFATILITNSHFAYLYPNGFQIFATGGTIGNSLFFFISGYSLFFSNNDRFVNWISKRFFRVLISYWVFLPVKIFLGESVTIIDFFIPTYWFLQAILLFYVIYFVITKYFISKLWIPILFIIVAYLVSFYYDNNDTWIIEMTDNPTKLHWYYYFLIMLFGALFATNKSEHKTNSFNTLEYIILIFLIVFYYSFKNYIISNQLYVFQFLVPIPLLFICWYSLKMTNTISILISGIFSRIIQFISNLTLEIYIVQFVIINLMVRYNYQLKFLYAIFLIILFAFLLNYISIRIKNVIFK